MKALYKSFGCKPGIFITHCKLLITVISHYNDKNKREIKLQIRIWVLCLSPFPLEYLDVVEGRLGARVLLFGVLNFFEML